MLQDCALIHRRVCFVCSGVCVDVFLCLFLIVSFVVFASVCAFLCLRVRLIVCCVLFVFGCGSVVVYIV